MVRLASLIGLCVVAALTSADLARACSCARDEGADGERAELASGGKAFIGRVVTKRRVSANAGAPNEVFTYRLRIDRSFNVRLGRTLELTESADDAMCGFEWRRGERVAGYLRGRPGNWSTSSCALANPDDLIRDSKPYPRPRRKGRVAALAYGYFSGARVMALDRHGRILGYGFRGGAGKSVCPGSGVVVESGRDRADRPLLYTRRISDLRVLSVRRAPDDDPVVRCLDASGANLAVFVGGGYPQGDVPPSPFRLVRMRGTAKRVLRRGVASFAAAISPRLAFTLEGRSGDRLVATDIGNGRSRRVAKIVRAEAPALSPDGTRLALISGGLPDPPRRKSMLVVVDLNRPVPRVNRRALRSPTAGGDLLWQDDRHLLRLPLEGRVSRYDSGLRPRGRLGLWTGGYAAVGGRRLLAVAHDRFRALDLRDDQGFRSRRLPTEGTSAVLAVPGEPRAAISPRKPRPRRPVVRRACAPKAPSFRPLPE